MANSDRGEMEVHVGGQTRTLRFRSSEVMDLEKRLGSDILAFLARNGGQTTFIVEAIFCGLTPKSDKVTPKGIARWLDDAEDLNRLELQKEIVYAVARGKPGEEGKRMVEVLDEHFNKNEDDGDEKPKNPTLGG